jgi:hypothetical protein
MHSIFLLPALLLLGASAYPTSPRMESPINPLTLRSLYAEHSPPTSLARFLFKQGPLNPHPSAEIKMQSTLNAIHPLSFTISPSTCKPLAHEVSCLTNDLLSHVASSHPEGVTSGPKCHDKETRIEESVAMSMNGKEYRATVEISVKGALEKGQFKGLMGLLGKTVQAIEEEREGKGMGWLVVGTTFEGVPVEARWTFYEVVGGVAVRCQCEN